MDLNQVLFFCIAVGIYFQVLRAAIKDIKPVAIVFGLFSFIALIVAGYFIFYGLIYSEIAIFFALLIVFIFAGIEKDKLISKLTKEKLLMDAMLLWFVIIWIIYLNVGLFYFVFIPPFSLALLYFAWNTWWVFKTCFLNKGGGILKKEAAYFFDFMVSIIIFGSVVYYNLQDLGGKIDFLFLIINGIVFGIMAASIIATFIEFSNVSRNKNESVFAYESRMKKYFFEDSEKLSGMSRIKFVFIIIILLAIFIASLVFNLLSVAMVVVIVVIAQQIILAAKPPTTSPSNN